MDVHKKYNIFVSAYRRAQSVNLTLMVEPIFLTSTLLMGALRATPAELASLLRVEVKATSCNLVEGFL